MLTKTVSQTVVLWEVNPAIITDSEVPGNDNLHYRCVVVLGFERGSAALAGRMTVSGWRTHLADIAALGVKAVGLIGATSFANLNY